MNKTDGLGIGRTNENGKKLNFRRMKIKLQKEASRGSEHDAESVLDAMKSDWSSLQTELKELPDEE